MEKNAVMDRPAKYNSLKQMAGRNFIFSLLLFAVLLAIIFIAFQRDRDSMNSLEQVYIDQFHIEQFRASLANVVRPLNDFALTSNESNFPKLKKAVKDYKASYESIKSIPHLTTDQQNDLDQVNLLMSEVMNIALDVADKKIPANQAGHVTVLAQNLVLATGKKLQSIVSSLEQVLAQKSAERQEKASRQLYILLGFILLIIVILELFNRRLVSQAQRLSKVSSSVATSAGDMLNVSEEQASATDQQSRFMDKVITGLEMVADSGGKIAITVAGMEKAAAGSSSFAKGGSEAMQDVTSSINIIRAEVGTFGETNMLIDQKMEQLLTSIAQVIEVTEESNLLALNASIESPGNHSGLTDEVQRTADQIRQVSEEMRSSVETMRALNSQSGGEQSNTLKELDHCIEISSRVSMLLDKTDQMSNKTHQSASVVLQVTERQNDRNTKILQALKHISELLTISGNKLQASREASKRLSEASESLQNMS